VSVRGPKHIDADAPCEDAWSGGQLEEDVVVLAVADGLGSASRSKEGAARVTEEAVASLTELLSDTDRPFSSDELESAIDETMNASRENLAQIAEKEDEPLDSFATTLFLGVAGPEGVAGAAVGDCGCVYAQDDSYEPLLQREMTVVDLSASHKTIPITHDRWEESYRFGFQDQYEAVAAFSDGFDEFAWEEGGPNPDFFGSVFHLVRDIPDPDEAADRMHDAFANEPYTDFKDDKTIAIGIF
jgi:hypothetical protein